MYSKRSFPVPSAARSARPLFTASHLLLLLSGIVLAGCDLIGQSGVYYLDVYPESAQRGTVSPQSREFDPGARVTLLARPFPGRGWESDKWDGDISSDENPYTFTIKGDTEAIARFRLKKYSLTIQIEGEGEAEHRLEFGGQEETYQHGSWIEVTATPAAGWEFVQWRGENFTFNRIANPERFQMWDDQVLTAIFRRTR